LLFSIYILCFQESLDKMECCATEVWHFTPWVFFGIAPFLMLCQPFSSFWIGHFHTGGFDLFSSWWRILFPPPFSSTDPLLAIKNFSG
jgi:hypothetical protein